VVRVWVPDRPGALGQVASRIGAVHGDVIGIDILERGGGRAIDELVVTLPSDDVVDLLVAEISQVDEAAVEQVHKIDRDRPEPVVMGLEIAARLVESAPAKRVECLCNELHDFVEADWALAVTVPGGAAVVELGDHPPAGWLAAFIEGSRHLTPEEQSATTPHDVAWAHLPGAGIAVAVGRTGVAFRSRERRQVALLGRVTDSLGC